MKIAHAKNQDQLKNFHVNGGKTSKNTKYITSNDNSETIRVKQEELENYLNLGWKIGTKRKK